MKKLIKRLRNINPFKIKSGKNSLKWGISPRIDAEDVKNGRIKDVGKDLLCDSEYNASINIPITQDVDLNLDYKGKLDNSDTNINVKFTKKF